MKPEHSLRFADLRPHRRIERGFALVITLSLMILLTVVAVGLLTLSGISLRTASQGSAMSTARSNARLALMMALGELQKNAGPDQRVTARADVLDDKIANPRLTGVWKSRDTLETLASKAADYEKTERDRKFVGWLASSIDGIAANNIDYAGKASASPVTLWGKGSLGSSATAADIVTASKVPTSPSKGAFAWAVMDEGVKVRVNTPYQDEAANKPMQTAQLGSGERPNTSSVTGLEDLKRESFQYGSDGMVTIDKGITRLNFGLSAENLAKGTKEKLKPLTHDVTSSSVGIFTDTAAGGLKEDFNLLTNSTSLPAPYAGTGVYASRLGMKSSTAPSDMRWESLQQFSRIYRDTTRLAASGGVPVLKAQAPTNWIAATSTAPPNSVTTINRTPPAGLVMLPTIAKVQVMFSLVGRDLYPNLPSNISGPLTPAQKAGNLHGPQDGHFRSTKYDYDLHLLYTPIVTLHNPYNVALECNNLRVEFLHVPFSLKIYRNGVAQSRDFVPLETMYGDNRDGAQDKIFGMNLKTKTTSGIVGSTLIRLLPGEVKTFSPYIDPARTYQTDLRDRKFWDIYVNTGITNNIDAIPGWRGDGIGFDCDNVAGAYAVDGIADNGHWTACLGMAWNDKFHVEFVPKNIPRANNKFVVKMTATLGSSSTPVAVSAIEVDYEKPDGLKEFIANTGVTMPMRYPKAGANPDHVLAQDLVDRASTPIGSLKKVKPFAMLSLQAKTSSGGRDANMEDGRLATKPWAFAHANVAASTQRVVSEHSANFSHEIDLQLLNGSSASLVQLDKQDRGNFITGHTSFNGTKFGALYDVPLAPLQSLVSLNGANPGGSSVYLPRFAGPIGNSWAHPLLDPSKIVTSGGSYPYLDHSFLLNLALYDHFYFSGITDQSGPFFNTGSKTVSTLVNDFVAGKPLTDPRLTLYTPDGKDASTLSTEIGAPLPHTKIAAWQMMNGAFNINSTSVGAWKAMLGSIHDSQAIFNKLNITAATPTSAFANLPTTNVDKNEARISRFRLPASTSEADGADPKAGYWLGTREYSEDELQTLAENIVEQVRLRGPFLSMSEFVNRRLGSDEKAQCGALQQAIDESNLNEKLANDANAGFNISESTLLGYKYANTKAGAGPSYQGAPGYLSQSDLLAVLGNAATPRSDTFTIRGYGEARDTNNNPIAKAMCEAVVQRVPDYIDSADKAEIAPASLTSAANRNFGRRFQMVSFRWLAANEI
jgi:hypothetical protein